MTLRTEVCSGKYSIEYEDDTDSYVLSVSIDDGERVYSGETSINRRMLENEGAVSYLVDSISKRVIEEFRDIRGSRDAWRTIPLSIEPMPILEVRGGRTPGRS